jgi:hypothetical protein
VLAAADRLVENAPAHPVACLQHDHGAVVVRQFARRGQPGEARADHHHVRVPTRRPAPASRGVRRGRARQRARAGDCPRSDHISPGES